VKIGIDLDNTINASAESMEFFKILTHSLINKHQIYIITNREIGTEEPISQELAKYEIVYSGIIITDQKARYIKENGITILFDNEDRYFLELDADVTVFKIREEYNFDFEAHKWRSSKDSTIIVELIEQ
jgi:hypothetical protein